MRLKQGWEAFCAAYYTVTDCVSDLGSCDMKQTNIKLEKLKNKKENLYLKLNGLINDMDMIIEEKRKVN